MNRSQRRAAVARGKTLTPFAPADRAALIAEANAAYQQGRLEQAEVICKRILARGHAHKLCLKLLGLINQESGRHRLAVKRFSEAIVLDELDAACHYHVGFSYQALGERIAAAAHFKKAITCGMTSDKDVEEYVMQNPVIARYIGQMAGRSNLQAKQQPLLDDRNIATVANDILLRCALEMTIVRGVALELFLTQLRFSLLALANDNLSAPGNADEEVTSLFCAVAQQCFNNEYVSDQSDEEMQLAGRLRDLLLRKMASGDDIPQLLLAAVACYFPLHTLNGAETLLAARWPPHAAALVRQQVREPMEEKADRPAIAVLTTIAGDTSLSVKQQYEENPYPRWTIDRLAALTGEEKRRLGAMHSGASGATEEILIAGCGTGQHSIEIAQYFPDARILAIDISRTSLAYARRKTRELGLQNIEYAQADILRLTELRRSFDRIGTLGVLHHLADPELGWRILLSLLRPGGVMRIGLYSEAARRPVVEARALIAERGYRATAEEMRAFRQMIIRNRDDLRWKMLLNSADFYSMSGCRDLLFNVMVHRFTIPQIAAFLREQGLLFLGFELDGAVVAKFREQFPGAEALTNLDHWNAFEAANPKTFRQMYIFSVRKLEHAMP
jgi:SAM-dependent methyltransferase